MSSRGFITTSSCEPGGRAVCACSERTSPPVDPTRAGVARGGAAGPPRGSASGAACSAAISGPGGRAVAAGNDLASAPARSRSLTSGRRSTAPSSRATRSASLPAVTTRPSSVMSIFLQRRCPSTRRRRARIGPLAFRDRNHGNAKLLVLACWWSVSAVVVIVLLSRAAAM